MITSIRGSIHQGQEACSEHSRGRQCAFMSLAALLFNRSNSVDLWTQTNVDDILCHGDRQVVSLFPRCARKTNESVTTRSKNQLKIPYYYIIFLLHF